MLTRSLLLFHTVRYLRPIQIYSRIKYKIYRPLVDMKNPPSVRITNSHWTSVIPNKPSLLSRWTFCFLNEEYSLNNSYDWDNKQFSKLWRYNLHYFDDLNAIDANSRMDWHQELFIKWIHENPPALGTGWESYPTSLRIVNWIKWALSGGKLDSECLHSLAVQIRWLSKKLEFHILGNHLFANAKALVFAGLFFEGAEANEWLKKGLCILKSEIPEQILSDGGHYERSPMYHAIVLEDVLDLINITQIFTGWVQEQQQSEWRTASRKMLHWFHHMTHPDGEISFFNDATFGIAATNEQLKSYAMYLGIMHVSNSDSLVYFSDSGYIKVGIGSAVGILDVAAIGPDYLPGHGHADTLSFELSLFGQRLFVNSGISQYGNDSIRQNQRSTISHNTVCIDHQNSSEVWAGFRVAKRAYPAVPVLNKTDEGFEILCSHNGYKKLPGKCTHERKWVFKNTYLCITDKISGAFKNAVAKYYIHPDVTVSTEDDMTNIFNLIMPTGQAILIKIEGANNSELIASNWYPEFGASVENKCISINFTSSELSVSIKW